MPKVGMEPIRRSALVQATIAEIGAVGSLDVTVGQIARRAGMSTALAHHYFGGKDQIFLAAMRHILTEYATEVRAALAKTTCHADRAAAIVRGSFAQSCFAPATISAWMTFYGRAASHPETLRLLHLYQRRLRSNLTHALRGVSADPVHDAETMAALIDGLYLRSALAGRDDNDACDAALRTLNTLIERKP